MSPCGLAAGLVGVMGEEEAEQYGSARRVSFNGC